jgi:hypothetical protein
MRLVGEFPTSPMIFFAGKDDRLQEGDARQIEEWTADGGRQTAERTVDGGREGFSAWGASKPSTNRERIQTADGGRQTAEWTMDG